MDNLIIIAVIVAILAAVIGYVVKEKKKGVKCIGCPSGCSCGKEQSGGCGCCGDNANH